MHHSTFQTSLLAMALVALTGCTGTDIELAESATAPINMTSSQPSNSEATNSASATASAAAAAVTSAAVTLPAITAKTPRIDAEAPANFQTATFALG
ncbi:MAG: hypothetical protein ACI8UD_001112 [Planctomycetota bacterium]|jgi:hypothetical protein